MMSNMSDTAAKLPKHHYIPVFYLKQWRDSTRRVIEFSKPYKNIVKPRNVDPDGTGYVRGLYRMPGVADEHAEIIEQTFFKRVDDQAAIAHQKLLKTDLMSWSLDLRKAWTLLVLSMFMRSPKIVADSLAAITDGLPAEWAEIQRKWANYKPEEPPLEDYNSVIGQQYSLLGLRRFIVNDEIGLLLLNMVAGTMDLSKTPYRLVTSDRPVVMTNGLGYRGNPEAGVAGVMRRRGYRVFFAENTLWHSLFGLLFWDELFESELLHSSFDWVPHCLKDRSFARRFDVIDDDIPGLFTAASGSLRFSSGPRTRPRRRISAGFNCIFPRRARASAIATAS